MAYLFLLEKYLTMNLKLLDDCGNAVTIVYEWVALVGVNGPCNQVLISPSSLYSISYK